MVDELRADVPNGRRAWRGWIVAVVAIGGLWQPGSATAATADATLQYTCGPGAPMTAQVALHMPPDVVVGRPIPTVTVTATATIPTTATAALGFIGVASADGSGDTTGVVVAPEGTMDAPVHLVIPPARVPTSGQMTFLAEGTITGLVFRRPGHATINIGNTLDLSLNIRDANGNSMFGGPVAEPCTLNPGQNSELSSFDITAPPVATTRKTALPPSAAAAPGTGRAGAPVPTSGPPTTMTTGPSVSVTPKNGPIRDSAAVTNHRRLPSYWWLPVVGTLAIVAGAIGCVRWLRHRRRAANDPRQTITEYVVTELVEGTGE